MFRFYLDNILVSDAINWIDFTETIERDDIIKALLPKYDSKLTFSGSGYSYIRSQYKAFGFCKLIEIKIDQSCDQGFETLLNGFIFISDCTFNLSKCTVDCSVMDNNFGAKIYNNKSIKAFLDVGRSKNDVAITPCAYDDIRVFTPTTGVYSADTRRAYDLKDAFRFLIDFMSDGQIGFESSDMTLNSILNSIRIVTGAELRSHDAAVSPFISFQDLFHEVNIRYPIGFTIINVAGTPTIKIELEGYFKSESNALTINNIQDLKQSFDSELMYSSVKFGGPFAEYDGVLYHYPQIRFFNFSNEEYHLQGECNIDKTLDLTANYISDTNIIEGLVATDTSNSSYDEDIFFVQIDPVTLDSVASNDPVTDTLPFYYNDKLKNNNVAERYMLQGNIAIYLGNNDDTFRAESTSNQDVSADFSGGVTNSANVFSSKIAFQNDSTGLNYDTNNNYNNTLYRYIAPANGNFNFESNLHVIIQGPGTLGTIISQIVFNVYDSGGTFQRSEFCPQYNYTPAHIPAGDYMVYGSKNVYLPASWYVEVRLSMIGTVPMTTLNSVDIITGSYFDCLQSESGGGVYQTEEPDNYFVSKFVFESPLSKTNYDLIKADLTKSVTINDDGQTNRVTWIRKTTRKMATGEMKWEMISSKNNSQ